MAYGEYKDSGRCSGKCLYQLHKIGIPLHIVESVIFSMDDHIKYGGKDFAVVEWDFDTPHFVFEEGFDHYTALQDRYYDKISGKKQEHLHLVADHISCITTGDCGFVAVCINPKTKKADVPIREVFDSLSIEDGHGDFNHDHTGFIVLKVETFPDRKGLYIMHVTIAKV